MIKLYSYFHSSASWRVRAALALKGIDYELLEIDLLKDGGKQHQQWYKAINPQALVPTLQIGERYLNQSLAIIEYLEEEYPHPSLLPGDSLDRANIRKLAYMIAMETQPLNNLKVRQHLRAKFNVGAGEVNAWMEHWMRVNFTALEQQLNIQSDRAENRMFCYGCVPTIADCCLIPQVYNAQRIEMDLSAFPCIFSIYQHCVSLDAFEQTHPKQYVA